MIVMVFIVQINQWPLMIVLSFGTFCDKDKKPFLIGNNRRHKKSIWITVTIVSKWSIHTSQ